MSFVRFYTSFCISSNTVSNVRKALKSHSVLFSIEHHLIEWHIEKPMRVVMYGKTLDNVACTMDSPVDRVKCQQICSTLSSLARSVASVWVCECFFLKPLNNRKLGALQVHKRRQQRRQNANTLRSFSFSSIQIGLPLLYLFCHCQMPFFTAAMGIRQTHKTISLKPIWTIRFKKKNTCRVSFCGRKEALLQVLTPFFHILHAIFHHSFSGTERFSVGNRTLFLAHTLPHVIHT